MAKINLQKAKTLVQNGIPYNYVVGQKGGTALPVNVTVSLDADFKKTIFKSVTIVTSGIVLATVASKLIKS